MMANTSASRPWETSEVSVDHKHHEKKKTKKKQCRVAASCTYHWPAIIFWLLNTSYTDKTAYHLTKRFSEFYEDKSHIK